MAEQTCPDRRTFLRRGAMGAGALWSLSLSELMSRRAYGSPVVASPYGPLAPAVDDATGLSLLQLPEGFRYRSYGWYGDVMTDGVVCPNLHDGMAVIDQQGSSGRLILVRNHETAGGAPFLHKPSITFAGDGAGGTTNVIFNVRSERFEKSWSSLAGTIRNCAGGVTPWGTWITSEETDDQGHGWNFDVGPQKGDPTPLYDMGRFSHEAVMVDPRTGNVYETEDDGNCGFYKFVPFTPGRLKDGGDLYMMKVAGRPNADLGGSFPLNTTWDVEWVRIPDPRATETSCYAQGAALGGARFRRLEGAWWGDRTGYFLSTDGGTVREGQVFEYNPEAETIRLIYDSQSAGDCENPDNITVTPRGGLLLCEDNSGGTSNPGERLLGLTLNGEIFTFAMNNIVLSGSYNSKVGPGNYRQAEWAGACYSPDGNWLFVNIQTPGVTFAITGPWGSGPL